LVHCFERVVVMLVVVAVVVEEFFLLMHCGGFGGLVGGRGLHGCWMLGRVRDLTAFYLLMIVYA
jgi:hypothetical protein